MMDEKEISFKGIIFSIVTGVIILTALAIVMVLCLRTDQKQEYNNVVVQYEEGNGYIVTIPQTKEKIRIAESDIKVTYTTCPKAVFNTLVKETTKIGKTRYKLYLEVSIF